MRLLQNGREGFRLIILDTFHPEVSRKAGRLNVVVVVVVSVWDSHVCTAAVEQEALPDLTRAIRCAPAQRAVIAALNIKYISLARKPRRHARRRRRADVSRLARARACGVGDILKLGGGEG